MWRNSRLWAGVAVDGDKVGGEERGSSGSTVRLPACFVNRSCEGILDLVLGQDPIMINILEIILGASQCATELGLEGCGWAPCL